ncbi:MAG: hypothetical protein ACOY94_23725 [Bacillota bacterium]
MQGADKERFGELNVERINVVDEDGTVRLVIANKERFPDPVIGGRVLRRQGIRTPGILFYNNAGDECGGLIFGSREENGEYSSGSALLFDQYRQDQIIGITTSESNGRRKYGFTVWERPDTPLADMVDRVEAVRQMEAGPEREQAMQQLEEEGAFGARRAFMGRMEDGEVMMALADSKGRDRIRMRVDANDQPRIEFLNEKGDVIFSLPPA